MSRLLVSLLCLAVAAQACSNVMVKTKAGNVIDGRTMDWGDADFSIVSYPEGVTSRTSAPDSKGEPVPDTGLKWKSNYKVVGIEMTGLALGGGINGNGLTCSLLYLPKYTDYMKWDTVKKDRALLVADVCLWALQKYGTVKEIEKAIKTEVDVWAPPAGYGPVKDTGAHFSFYDNTGKGLVVEWIKGETRIHDTSDTGVMTNAPPMDFHEMSMADYGNMVIDTADGSSSQGSGMTGLPGSYTSTDRFIRLRKLREKMDKAESTIEGVNQVATLLGEVTVVKGTVRQKLEGGAASFDRTEYTTIKDCKNKVFYYKHRLSPNFNKVDLKDVNFGSGKQTFELYKKFENVYDVSEALGDSMKKDL